MSEQVKMSICDACDTSVGYVYPWGEGKHICRRCIGSLPEQEVLHDKLSGDDKKLLSHIRDLHKVPEQVEIRASDETVKAISQGSNNPAIPFLMKEGTVKADCEDCKKRLSRAEWFNGMVKCSDCRNKQQTTEQIDDCTKCKGCGNRLTETEYLCGSLCNVCLKRPTTRQPLTCDTCRKPVGDVFFQNEHFAVCQPCLLAGTNNSERIRGLLMGFNNQIAALGASPKPQETILEEAARITSSDRQKLYGTPYDNHGRTAALWSAYLGRRISRRQVCVLNILQKLSRDAHKPHRDNLVDAAGYARNIEMMDGVDEPEACDECEGRDNASLDNTCCDANCKGHCTYDICPATGKGL